MEFKIRKANEKDVGAIIALMRDFADFEKLGEYLEVSEEKLHEAMFGDNALVEGLIVLDDSRAIAYALFYPCFSSFRCQQGYFLEDLYIDTAYRGKGIGELLLREIAKLARARGFDRIDFHVLEWNKLAIGFYEKLGAVCAPEERYFKFTDAAFESLVNKAG